MAKHKDWKQDKELLLSGIDMLTWDIKNNDDCIKRNLKQNKQLREQTVVFKKQLTELRELITNP